MSNTETLSSGNRPALVVKVGNQAAVSRFGRSFTIGRGPENDLVLEDPSVSQRHAEVVLEGGEWRLRDLGSTNGTVVAGKQIDEVVLTGALRVRLGHHGPALLLTPQASRDSEREDTAVPSDSFIARRYLSRRAPKYMGTVTARLRVVLAGAQKRRARKYWIALGVVSLIAASAGLYAYVLHQRIERQRAAAEEVFYAAKGLELQVAVLELSAAERQSYRERRVELDKQYRDFVEELGIYSVGTAEEVQLIYRMAHRFGESEVNVPRDFVDEVLRYIERWKSSTRLEQAIARIQSDDYGQRVAEIMLEHDLPPELFYLALQESDLRLDAVGPSTRFGIAKGMWQLIPGTAREYGLRTGPLVGVRRYDPADERHDFEKSTQAAARYLRRIYNTDAQASGLLVVAAYNWGQTRIIRLIRSLPQHPRQRNFWQLLVNYRSEIPQETYDYIFNVVSAAVIGENPQLFGFEFDPPFRRPEPVTETLADASR